MDRSQLNAWQEMTLAIFLTDFFFLDAKDDISNMGKGDWSGVAKKNLPFLFLLSQIIEVMVHSETQGKKEMQILSCCAVDVGWCSCGGFKIYQRCWIKTKLEACRDGVPETRRLNDFFKKY